MAKRHHDVVSASEIASWAWCPESWRLGQGLGLRPGNEAQLAQGERFHVQTAAVERHTGSALRVGLVLFALGLIALGAYLLASAVR